MLFSPLVRLLRRLGSNLGGRVAGQPLETCRSARFQVVFPGELLLVPDFADLHGIVHPHFQEYPVSVPAFGVLHLRGGICRVGREEVFTSRKRVIAEFTSQRTNPALGMEHRDLRVQQRLRGTVAFMSLSGLENNYYHFTVEFLARWFLLASSGIHIDTYVLAQETKFQRQFLRLLGIPETAVLNAPHGRVLQAENLIVPSLVNNWKHVEFRAHRHFQKEFVPTWLASAYTRLAGNSRPTGRKIYLSRAKAQYRKVINEVELREVLGGHGVETWELEGLDVEAQIALFASSSLVIGAHGANLANLAYCREGTKVLELFPAHYHDSGLRLLAWTTRLDYHYLIGTTPGNSEVVPQQEDLVADVRAIERWLNTLPSAATRGDAP